MVICDPSQKYGLNFVMVASELESKEFSYNYYQQIESVLDFQKNQEIDILLVDEKVDPVLRRRIIAHDKYVLSSCEEDKEEQQICMLNHDESKVNKYQSIDSLLYELQECKRQQEQKQQELRQQESTSEELSYQVINQQRIKQQVVEQQKIHEQEHFKDLSIANQESNPQEKDTLTTASYHNHEQDHIQHLPYNHSLSHNQNPSHNQNETDVLKVPTLPPVKQRSENNDKKLIAVYSPIHRIGKTKFAIELGKEFARTQSTLYLNLEGYAGSSYFLDRNTQDLSSLIYHAKQDREGISMLLSSMVSQLGNLDYIEPVVIANELLEVHKADWLFLIHSILDHSIYDVVVMDLGEKIQGLFDILAICDTIYTPYIEESVALGKLKQYTENLIRCGYSNILEHTVQKRLAEA